MRDPFVIAVLQAYRWWKANQLDVNYGGQVPEAIRRGIDVYDHALHTVRAHDDELDRKRREAEAADRVSGGGSRPPISRRR